MLAAGPRQARGFFEQSKPLFVAATVGNLTFRRLELGFLSDSYGGMSSAVSVRRQATLAAC
jgi:hypothetical protein